MNKSDDAPIRPGDIALALALLSRLPVRAKGFSRSARAAWAYPVAGALIALLAGTLAAMLGWFGLPSPLVALACLAALTILTGAMHEDGLADTADGLWGGWDRAARLRIMKDSHIGTYGVLALVFTVMMRAGALWALFVAGSAAALLALVAAAMLSRAVMACLMTALSHARSDGLSASVGRVPGQSAAIAVAIAILPTLFLTGWAGLGAILLAGALMAITGAIAQAKIGGQTGDILGAAQQVTETAVLLTFAAAL